MSGDDFQNLIAYSFFDKQPCREEDFTYFQSLQCDNCHTFNKKRNNSTFFREPANDKTTELEII